MYSEPIQKLISELSKLPGIGRKSAQRIAYHLISRENDDAIKLAEAIGNAVEHVVYCSECFNISDCDPCAICSDSERDHSVICVVSDSRDVLAIERTREYKGVYHVLGGALSPMDGIGPEELTIRRLMSRLTPEVKEVILATNLNVEGETTAMYIARLVKTLDIKTTRIARGIPVGADLEYADEATLANAIEGRREV